MSDLSRSLQTLQATLTDAYRSFMEYLPHLAAALLLLPGALPAQGFTTDDPVVRRIWEEGMSNSQVARLAQVLMDSIGPRLAGSPGMKSARDWLERTYTGWGVPVRQEKYGTWRGWEHGLVHLDLVAPRPVDAERAVAGDDGGVGPGGPVGVRAGPAGQGAGVGEPVGAGAVRGEDVEQRVLRGVGGWGGRHGHSLAPATAGCGSCGSETFSVFRTACHGESMKERFVVSAR